MKKLQHRLILIIVFGILLATFISGATSLYSFSSVERERSLDILEKELKLSANYFNEEFDDVEYDVKTLSEYYLRDCPKELDLTGEEGISYIEECKKLAKTLMSSNEIACSIYFRINPEIANSTSGFFLSATSKNDVITELEPTDLSLYEPDDVEHVGWYYIPVEAQSPIWMDEYFNLNNDILMISYVAPLYMEDGTLLGVVGIDINMESVYERVAQVKLYETGVAALMSDKGEIRNAVKDISISEEEKEQILQSESGMKLTYLEQQKEMTLLSEKLTNGDYLLLTIENEELYARENQVIITLITINIVVSALIIFLLTGILYGMINRFERDTMTKAGNRSFYAEEVSEIDHAIRLKRRVTLTVLVFDINGLKKTNNLLGHAMGDQLITDAANLIRKYFPNMTIYRIGGDEFAICTKTAVKNAVIYQFDRFREEMYKRAQNYDFEAGTVVISSGIAVYDREKDHCYEDVFNRADQDMYQNKTQFYKMCPQLDRRKN